MAINTSTLTLTAERHRTRPLLGLQLAALLTFIILARQLAIVAGQTSTSSSCCLRISRSWLRRSRTWPVTYRASHHRRHRLQFLILCSVAFDYLTEKRVRFLPWNVEIIVRLARDCSLVGCPSYCDTYAAFFLA